MAEAHPIQFDPVTREWLVILNGQCVLSCVNYIEAHDFLRKTA